MTVNPSGVVPPPEILSEDDWEATLADYGEGRGGWTVLAADRAALRARVEALTTAIRDVQEEWMTQADGWRERVVARLHGALLVAEPEKSCHLCDNADPMHRADDHRRAEPEKCPTCGSDDPSEHRSAHAQDEFCPDDFHRAA